MTNMFIKLEGSDGKAIEGESTISGHDKEIELLSWSHGFNQPTSPVRSTAGGGTVERANHSDFSFAKYVDSSSDDLIKQCWGGKTLKKATVSCYRADGPDDNTPVKYLSIEMQDVIVSNYTISGGGGDVPVENVTLSYGIVKYEYLPQDKASGTAQGASPQHVQHDLKTNTVS